MKTLTYLSRSVAPCLVALGLALATSSCANLSAQDPYGGQGHLNEVTNLTTVGTDIHFGVNDINSGLLEDVDRQPSFGFSINNHDPEGTRPFGYEFSGFISQTEEIDSLGGGNNQRLEGSMTELAFGLRRNFRPMAGFVPFVGAGISAILAEREAWGPTAGDFESNSELAAGFYLHGGVYYMLGEDYRIGVDFRATPFTTEVELVDGADKDDLEHYQATFFFGFSF